MAAPLPPESKLSLPMDRLQVAVYKQWIPLMKPRDLVILVTGKDGMSIITNGTSPEVGKAILFTIDIEQQRNGFPIFKMHIAFNKGPPLTWMLFCSQATLCPPFMFLKIEGLADLKTVDSVDDSGRPCLMSYLMGGHEAFVIFCKWISNLFKINPQKIIFQRSMATTWVGIDLWEPLWKAEIVQIDVAPASRMTTEILKKRGSLGKVTSFNLIALDSKAECTGELLSTFKASIIRIGGNNMCAEEISNAIILKMETKNPPIEKMYVSIEHWTPKEAKKLTKTLGLKKFHWKSNSNFVPPRMERYTEKCDLWWTNPENIPAGSQHWIFYFSKNSTDQLLNLELEKWTYDPKRAENGRMASNGHRLSFVRRMQQSVIRIYRN